MAAPIESVRALLLAQDPNGFYRAGLLERPEGAGRAGQWEAPGGQREPWDQDAFDTARREIDEELGIKEVEFLTQRPLLLPDRIIPDGPRAGEVISVTGLAAVVRGPRTSTPLAEHVQEVWLRPRVALRQMFLTEETEHLIVAFRRHF